MNAPSYLLKHAAEMSRKMRAAESLTDDYWSVPLPDRLESGQWRIEKFELPNPLPMGVSVKNIQHLNNEMPEFVVSPGTYHRLVGPCGDDGEDAVMMSNTQLEYRTNLDFVKAAKGDVFIAGLGLGMLLGPLASKPEVTSITVAEISWDVIDMVEPHYRALRVPLYIHPNDAKNYVPDHSFDAIMLDIWPDVSGENLPEMAEMKAYYREYLRPGGYIECWSESLARRMEAKMAAMLDGLRRARG